MQSGLGFIITPYGQIPGAYPSEIVRTSGGGVPLCPFDPQYNTRGEQGLYYDTQLGRPIAGAQLVRRRPGLGDIPNDFEIARVRGILTPNSGWIATNNGTYNEPWVPPNGWSPTGATNVRINYGVPPQLGDATTDAVAAVVAELNQHHKRVFMLSALSTAAVVFGSIIAAVRTVRLMRQEGRRG